MPERSPAALAIAPRHLAMLHEVLRAHLADVEIRAYGSRVNGESHEASDLDLVALLPERGMDAFTRLHAAREALTESNLPIRVDLLDWNSIPAAFQREIERAYVVIQPAIQVNPA